MNNKKTRYLPLLSLILFVLLLQACKGDKNASDALTTEAVKPADHILERDNVKADKAKAYVADDALYNPRNTHWYTYHYENESITSETPIARDNNNQENPGDTTTQEVYDITETSRPPLFDKNCLTALNPEACSNEAVIDWMKYAVERPKSLVSGQDMIHFVTFIIDKKGQVSDAKIMPTRHQKPCEPCKAATLEAVNGMATWLPAVRNGKTVRVRVIIPVYYDE